MAVAIGDTIAAVKPSFDPPPTPPPLSLTMVSTAAAAAAAVGSRRDEECMSTGLRWTGGIRTLAGDGAVEGANPRADAPAAAAATARKE